MSKEKAEYEISLKDLFSKPMGDAEKSTQHFEKGLSHAKETVHEFAKTVGELYVVEKGFEFLKESAQDFMKMESMTIKLKASIGMNGGLASDIEALKEQAEELAGKGIFSDEQITQAETMASQFGYSAKQIQELMPTVLDVAAATGKSVEDVMSQVQAGTMGMGRTLKKEFGIVVEDTGSKSKNLENTLTALRGKFEGMNETIANTTEGGKIARMGNQLEMLREKIGEGLMKVFDKIQPYIQRFIEALMPIGDWISEHIDLIEAVGAGILVAATAFGVITTAIEVWTAVQWLLNEAMYANPIGLIVAAIGVLAAGIYYAWNKFEGFRKVILAVWDVIKTGWILFTTIIDKIYDFIEATGILQNLWEGLKIVFSAVGDALEWIYDHTLKPIFEAIGWVYQKIKDLLGIKPSVDVKINKKETSIFDNLGGVKPNPGMGAGMSDKTKADSVSGQKSTIINVNIGKLVETIKLTSATMTQGIGQIKEEVAKALIEAVNDSQIIAGG